MALDESAARSKNGLETRTGAVEGKSQRLRNMEESLDHLEHLLTQLADRAHPVRVSDLLTLSHLDEEGRALFNAHWPIILAERRRHIVRLLVEQGEEDVTLDFNAVFLACLADADAQIRVSAIRGLWEYEGRGLIPRLKELAARDPDPGVRAEAALGLGRYALLGECGALREAEAEDIFRALRAIVADPEETVLVRGRALEAVGVCSQDWVKALIGEAYESGDRRLHISAIHAMGRNCDDSWLPILLEELASDDPETRYEAATACGAISAEKAVPRLTTLLDDEDAEVQAAAISALGQIGGREAKTVLAERLSQDEGPLRALLEEALAEADFADDPMGFRTRL